MKNYLLVLLLALTACTTTPYVAPQVCSDPTQSVILTNFPDPRILDKALLSAQYAAIKTLPDYDRDKAESFLYRLGDFVTENQDLTYAGLVNKIKSDLLALNEDTQAILFIAGPNLDVIGESGGEKLISECDKSLFWSEFYRQQNFVMIFGK